MGQPVAVSLSNVTFYKIKAISKTVKERVIERT
jgi:hypothetical protein